MGVANAITEHATPGELGNCEVFCPIVEECFKENSKSTERERVSPLCLPCFPRLVIHRCRCCTYFPAQGCGRAGWARKPLDFRAACGSHASHIGHGKRMKPGQKQHGLGFFWMSISSVNESCVVHQRPSNIWITLKILWLSQVWCSLATNADMTLLRKQHNWEILVLYRKSRRVKSSRRNRRLSALTLYHFLPPLPDFILV